MRILFSISFLILLSSCKQETIIEKDKPQKTKVSDVEIHGVINSICISKNDSTKTNYVTEDLSPLNERELFVLTKMDTLLSKEDVEFIKEQNDNRKKFKLNQQLIENKVIPIDSLRKMRDDKTQKINFWERFTEKYHEKSLMSISLAVFSKDKKIAIVTTSRICATCINRETSIYRKIKGRWKYVMPVLIAQT